MLDNYGTGRIAGEVRSELRLVTIQDNDPWDDTDLNGTYGINLEAEDLER